VGKDSQLRRDYLFSGPIAIFIGSILNFALVPEIGFKKNIYSG